MRLNAESLSSTFSGNSGIYKTDGSVFEAILTTLGDVSINRLEIVRHGELTDELQ